MAKWSNVSRAVIAPTQEKSGWCTAAQEPGCRPYTVSLMGTWLPQSGTSQCPGCCLRPPGLPDRHWRHTLDTLDRSQQVNLHSTCSDHQWRPGPDREWRFEPDFEWRFGPDLEWRFGSDFEWRFGTDLEWRFRLGQEKRFSTRPRLTLWTWQGMTFSTWPRVTFSTWPRMTYWTWPWMTFSTCPEMTWPWVRFRTWPRVTFWTKGSLLARVWRFQFSVRSVRHPRVVCPGCVPCVVIET